MVRLHKCTVHHADLMTKVRLGACSHPYLPPTVPLAQSSWVTRKTVVKLWPFSKAFLQVFPPLLPQLLKQTVLLG